MVIRSSRLVAAFMQLNVRAGAPESSKPHVESETGRPAAPLHEAEAPPSGTSGRQLTVWTARIELPEAFRFLGI